MTAPLYVCVYVPEFPAQALMRLRPELAWAPVVVLAGDPPLQEVCSANAQATKLGVTHGMTRAELDGFTGLSVLRRSLVEEANARTALLAEMGRFTPRIEVQPSASSAWIAVMDMTGTTRMFGPASEAITSIARAIAGLRVFAQFAASANLRAAVCVAPSARKAPLIMDAGKEAQHLCRLPLAALELDRDQSETLALWGLHTLGDLAAMPEVELVVRLGQKGKRLRLLARGEHPHLMVPAEPVFFLEEFIAFDSPVDLLDSLLFVLGPMLDQLIARAQNRALGIASVTVTLGLDGGGVHERSVRPALPVAKRDVLLKLLHLDLQAHPPSAGVMSVRVHADPGEQSKVQLGIWSPQLPEALRLDVTLARIAAVVGEDRVGRARLLDTHAPENFAMERFTVIDTSKAKAKDAAIRTVLRRYRPPIKISVQHHGQQLEAFSLEGKWYAVQEAYGPWRRSGQWWSSDVWSREEWDVCAVCQPDSKLNCVLVHDLLHHFWQLEALYD